jgi:hypothetical protein
MKTLTGGETVTARFLHAQFFEFKTTFKLWLAANRRPVIREHPPFGFNSFDTDLYTSTRTFLKAFRDELPLTKCLPRVL